jgi:hypothetical protein
MSGFMSNSLTRPEDPASEYGGTTWQARVGPILVVAGVMALTVFFIITAVVAGWVADLTDPNFTNLASQAGRIEAYKAWLLPVAIGSIGVIKIGIALILWGIVRRLWVRVEGLKQSLPDLVGQKSGS